MYLPHDGRSRFSLYKDEMKKWNVLALDPFRTMQTISSCCNNFSQKPFSLEKQCEAKPNAIAESNN